MKKEFIGKEMFVWDGDHKPDHPAKRIVLFMNEDGSCVVVNEVYREDYSNGEGFMTGFCANCEEIPEKKIVPMTHHDCFVLASDGALFKTKHETVISYWYDNNSICEFKYSKDWKEKGLENATWLPLTKEVEE